MELTDEQRRAVIAMCCAVARADGEVSPAELERLLDILSRLGNGIVSFAELQRWLEQGPPEPATQLPSGSIRACVQEALSVAHADGSIDDAEVQAIKSLAQRHLE